MARRGRAPHGGRGCRSITRRRRSVCLVTFKNGSGEPHLPYAEAVEENIEAAKRDGSWDRLNEGEALDIPPELAAALEAHPEARSNFDAFPPSSRRGILEWILNANRPKTLAMRIEETVRLAGRNIKANHYRQ